MNTFWREFADFKNKRGVFARGYIWAAPNIDTRPDVWHHYYSYTETEVLGKLACIVCSKLLGSGPCERAWGDYKHQTDGKRKHLTPDKAEKQAALFGKYCSEKARARRKEDFKFKVDWDEADFDDLGFGKFGINISIIGAIQPAPRPVRKFFAFIEDWEREPMANKCRDNELLLLTKYANVHYCNIDDGRFVARTVDSNRMKWTDRKDARGHLVVGRPDGADPDDDTAMEKWTIDSDFFFMVRVYYKHMDPESKHLRVVTHEEYKGLGTPTDEQLIDEWIENGGEFSKPTPQEQLATIPKKQSRPRHYSGNRHKARSHTRPSKKVAEPVAQQPEPDTQHLEDSGDSASDDQFQPKPKIRRVVDGGCISSGSGDSDSSTVGD